LIGCRSLTAVDDGADLAHEQGDEMAYTQEGIMAQIWIAFGQGAGAIRVTQDAAMELRRWYFDAITPQVVDVEWETSAIQVLDRIRAIGSLAAMKATSVGSTAIVPQDVYDSAVAVQESSGTPLCPDPPPILS
jgi:methionyl-tRNA formyltransferase